MTLNDRPADTAERIQTLTDEGTDFIALQEWKDGLASADLPLLKDALANGVDVATYIDDAHPLQHLLFMPQKAPRIMMMPDGQFMAMPSSEKTPDARQRLLAINLLLANGLPVLDKVKGTDKTVVECCIDSEDDVLVARVVLAALKQALEKGEKPYALDLTQELNPDEFQHLAKVHDIVRIALEKTKRPEDRALFDAHAKELSFWMQDFPKPPEQPPMTREQEAKFEKMLKNAMGGGPGMEEDEDDNIEILPDEKPEDVLADIRKYAGMDDFYKNMQALVLRVEFDKAREAKGLKTEAKNYHTAFIGNPGTGKTTAARLKARLLHSLGLTGPRFAVLSRESIISGYHNMTESKVAKVFDDADIVFWDEAYSLTDDKLNKSDAGNRAVQVAVARMGQRKDDITLFLAGYPKPMREFIKSNEGLASRIKVYQEMRDYTIPELATIFDRDMKEQGYTITSEAKDYLTEKLTQEKASLGDLNFGNARIVVSLMQDIPDFISMRLGTQCGGDFSKIDAGQLAIITLEDVKSLYESRFTLDSKETRPTVGYKTNWMNASASKVAAGAAKPGI